MADNGQKMFLFMVYIISSWKRHSGNQLLHDFWWILKVHFLATCHCIWSLIFIVLYWLTSCHLYYTQYIIHDNYHNNQSDFFFIFHYFIRVNRTQQTKQNKTSDIHNKQNKTTSDIHNKQNKTTSDIHNKTKQHQTYTAKQKQSNIKHT